jgi:hypothetical protein
VKDLHHAPPLPESHVLGTLVDDLREHAEQFVEAVGLFNDLRTDQGDERLRRGESEARADRTNPTAVAIEEQTAGAGIVRAE